MTRARKLAEDLLGAAADSYSHELLVDAVDVIRSVFELAAQTADTKQPHTCSETYEACAAASRIRALPDEEVP